jgi:hypothetical protein
VCHDGHALIANKLLLDPSCQNLLRVVPTETQQHIEERDANFFLTLSLLAEHLAAIVDDVVPVFVEIFGAERSEEVYICALGALTQIVEELRLGGTIPVRHASLVPSIMVLLRKNHPKIQQFES